MVVRASTLMNSRRSLPSAMRRSFSWRSRSADCLALWCIVTCSSREMIRLVFLKGRMGINLRLLVGGDFEEALGVVDLDLAEALENGLSEQERSVLRLDD